MRYTYIKIISYMSIFLIVEEERDKISVLTWMFAKYWVATEIISIIESVNSLTILSYLN